MCWQVCLCLRRAGAARPAVCPADDPAQCRAQGPHGAAARALPGRLPGQGQPAAVATLQGVSGRLLTSGLFMLFLPRLQASPESMPVLCLTLQLSHSSDTTSLCVLLPGQQSVHVHASSAFMVRDVVC